jgi:ubiquinone/menaquinone biosynthesis C-methylase UbiE
MTGSKSVSFDRAAEYYDRTRSNPEGTQRRVTAVLATELRGRGRTLEIGVGTGRIALPLNAEGIPLAGADLSRPMVDQLVLKAGGRVPFPLVQADATRLPFATASFGAALAFHVLHLIPAWRGALAEMVRTVRPGGVVLVDAGTSGRGWRQKMQDRFQAEAGIERRFSGVESPEEVDGAMAELGLRPRLLAPVRASATLRPGDGIDSLEAGEYSWTWTIGADVRRRAAAATRVWARERFGDLEQRRRARWTIRCRAYDVPG